MIVRVMFEGQYEIDGRDLDKLNDVDNQIVEAIANSDEQAFTKLMAELHTLVIKHGQRVADDRLEESDIILPAPDSTMDEVREMFAGEGLIPG